MEWISLARRPREKVIAEFIERALDVNGLVVSIKALPDMSPAMLDSTKWASIVRSYMPMISIGDTTQPRLVVFPVSIQQQVFTRAHDADQIQIVLSAMQKLEVDNRTKKHKTNADQLMLLVEQSLKLLACQHLIDLCEGYGGVYLQSIRRDAAFEAEMARSTHAIVANSLLTYVAIYDRCSCECVLP